MMLLKDWFLQKASSYSLDRILLLDGGVSTHLEELLGSSSFEHRQLWSSSLLLTESGRSLIHQGHVDWLQAGANVISTVTYQCHYQQELWPSFMTSNQMDTLWKDALTLARQAATTTSRPSFVAASSGCYGAALANGAEYTGDYGDKGENDLIQFHLHKLQRALPLQPDCIAIETIPSIQECRALAKLLTSDKLNAGDFPSCWISLSCRNESELNDETPLKLALQVLRSIPTNRLQAIGLNCCDSQYLGSLAEILVTDMALAGPVRGIVLYPNSGEAWDAATETWKQGTGCTQAEEMADRIMQIIQTVEDTWKQYCPNDPVPSMLVGGCCRTTPAAIAALRSKVDKHLKAEAKK